MIQVQKIYTFPARKDIHVLKAWRKNNNHSLFVCVCLFPKIVIVTNLFSPKPPSTRMYSPQDCANIKNMYSVCMRMQNKGLHRVVLVPRDRPTPKRVVVEEGLINVARRGLFRRLCEKGFQFVVVQNNNTRNQVFRRWRRARSQSFQLLVVYRRIV